ncbi:efflux transporter outer membrane subunit [Roseateles violae]|uniref:Efflux transporter outer membrane subunit n=1 Tax=Roseateles violae TaxID=3058042 RepID=A0ABT8DSK8_9BURK|nr:efflux transporter outer membrane subunit [Pelomonas sp. PFR6]MDN3921311.1 efflux transporter outer membrane subunit [Pelomonas sp. PFR6]
MLSLPLSLLLGGCMLGPDYRRPEVQAPASFRFDDGRSTEAVARELANTAWWSLLRDPVLDQLIAEGLANNKNLAIAAARVDAFYGAYGSTRSALFPQLGAELAGTRQRASQSTISPAPGSNPFNTVQGDLFIAWELDLFGRLRRLDEAARAELLGSEAARSGAVLSLTAAIASAYVGLRALDRQLEISRDTLKSRSEALELFRKRFAGGVISELELNQAQSEYALALASVPELERQIAQQENALSLLLGRNPGPIARGLSIDRLALPAVPAGLPSELLERRPDIREAEQALVAANARIGAAKAQYFPRISLTGLFGGASTSLNNLFESPGRVWSFAGSVSMPIFTAGGIAGQVTSAEAQQRAALYGYQQAVQASFRDVEDALIGSRKIRERFDAQALQVQALRSYARHARARYEEGFSSYLEVLDAQRSLFSAELRYTQDQADTFAQVIALYKALGGGWLGQAEALAPQPQASVQQTPALLP